MGEPTSAGGGTRTGGFPAVLGTGDYPAVPAADAGGGARSGRGRGGSVRLYAVVPLDGPHGAALAPAGADGGRPATPPVGMPAVAPPAPADSAPGDGNAGDAGRRDAAAAAADGTEVLVYRDVGAVVAPASYVAEPQTARELDRYRDVIDALFARRAVVPAPPGTVFRSRELVAGWLELHYYTLVEALSFLEDRAVARVSVARAEPSSAHSLRLAPADTGELTVAGDLTSLAAESFRALRADAVSLLILRAPSDAVMEDETAHGSFLVDRRRWEEFERAVSVEAARHPTLRFRCTGPWPPYDFVRMQFTG